MTAVDRLPGQPGRKAWGLVAGSVVALLAGLAAGGAAWLAYSNRLPPYTPPAVRMPSPNAFDDYVAAGGLLPASIGSVDPSNGSPAALRPVVAAGRPALGRLRQGLPREFRNPPCGSFSQTYPELREFRDLGKLLYAEGRLAEGEGRYGDAVRSYLDCLRFGAEVPRGGPLIHGLSGLVVQYYGLVGLDRLGDRLDGETAARAAREMARLERGNVGAADMLAGERDAGLKALNELLRRSDHWNALSAMTGSPPSTPVQYLNGALLAVTPKSRILRSYVGYYDRVIASARQPYGLRSPAPPLPDDPINRLLLPTFTGVGTRADWRDACWRVLESRLAARAFAAQRGAPPSTLAALVPAYLPAVPQDPYAPGPLVYRISGERPLVYSRGSDGDDDGGRDIGEQAIGGANGDLMTTKGVKLR